MNDCIIMCMYNNCKIVCNRNKIDRNHVSRLRAHAADESVCDRKWSVDVAPLTELRL